MQENLGLIIGMVIGGIIGVIIGLFFTMVEKKISEKIYGIMVFALVFIGIGMFFGLAVDSERAPVVVTEEIVYKPVSMGDTMGSEGEGNLTYIRIDANQYYTFYYKEENGYKLGKINAAEASVYQTDETEPKIIRITHSKKYQADQYIYEIYIPEGSIVEQFHLDSN